MSRSLPLSWTAMLGNSSQKIGVDFNSISSLMVAILRTTFVEYTKEILLRFLKFSSLKKGVI